MQSLFYFDSGFTLSKSATAYTLPSPGGKKRQEIIKGSNEGDPTGNLIISRPLGFLIWLYSFADMRLIWADEMGWMHFPGVWLKQMSEPSDYMIALEN